MTFSSGERVRRTGRLHEAALTAVGAQLVTGEYFRPSVPSPLSVKTNVSMVCSLPSFE